MTILIISIKIKIMRFFNALLFWIVTYFLTSVKVGRIYVMEGKSRDRVRRQLAW